MAGRSGKLAVFALLLGLCHSVVAVQAKTEMDPPELLRTEVEFHHLPPATEVLKLAHGFIEPGSLQIIYGDSLLVDGRDFRLRGRSGTLIPLYPWERLNGFTSSEPDPALLVISYRFTPGGIPARMDLRPVGAGPDQGPGLLRKSSAEGLSLGELGEGNLIVHGSKTIQVSSGTRRDMVVDQNLRLDISGQLTPDISVRAFLSDDNLPVVPEGNTQQLRDIDKVLVQLKGKRWSSTFGDFVAQREGTTFGNYRRKLQGVSVTGNVEGFTYEVLAGSPRGRYRTLQIKGQEANQGPYFLGAGDNVNNLFIVAGSERVKLDGTLLVRGADRDYVVDYIRGTITFTYKRLITAESSIVVEFEEGEGPYGRTVTGAGAGLNFELPGSLGAGLFRMRMISEKDDPARLRTGELGPEDQSTLALAGDNPQLALASGATLVPDSTGTYDLITLGDEEYYVQNLGAGAWDVSFYFVGPQLGAYELDSLGPAGERLFTYRGQNEGSYAVGRPLELPSTHSMVTMFSVLGDTAGAHLGAEWDLSREDLNRLSERDDSDNSGNAFHLTGASGKKTLRLGKRDLGRGVISGAYSNLTATFRPFDLVRDIFAYRQWGLEKRAQRKGFLDEADRQWTLSGNWETGGDRKLLQLGLTQGGLEHGEGTSADRTQWQGKWRWHGLTGNHSWNEGSAQDKTDPLHINNTQRRHEISWQWGWLKPALEYGFERWQDTEAPAETAGGYRREHYGWSLDGKNGRALNWQLSFKHELADSLRTNTWQKERDGRISRFNLATGNLAGLRLVGEGTMRRVRQPGLPEQTTRLGQTVISGKWQRTATDFSLGYRVDNSRTEVLDRQILFVGDRQGDFDQDGRYLGENLGSFDMILAGTDSLVATTAVKADLNWRQGFDFLGREHWYGAWSLFTLASVEGRSTTEDIGRLLALSPSLVLEDSTTVLGDVNISEEVTLFKNHKAIDVRAKFDFRQTRDRQFATHPEDRLMRNWQARGSFRVSRATSWQWRVKTSQENRQSTEDVLSVRRSFQVATRDIELGWTFGPGPDFRFSLQGEYISRVDAVTGVDQTEWAGHPTVRRRLGKNWTLQSDVRVGKVRSVEPAGEIRPWFFPTDGVKVDSSFRLNWQASQFLTFSGSWFARKEGQRRWQHDVRLESTARF